MTEQEKRKTAIGEIVNILDDTDKCTFSFCQGGVSCNECEASLIYDKVILRKEEEVRKETAKEIISILNCEKGLRPKVVTDYWDRIDNVISFIQKEFCAEVEE